MRKDSPLARKESIQPQDLWDKPLIVSHQKGDDVFLHQRLQRDESQLHIAATYNLILNASLFVDEGLGYALCYEKLFNTNGSNLWLRTFFPGVRDWNSFSSGQSTCSQQLGCQSFFST